MSGEVWAQKVSYVCKFERGIDVRKSYRITQGDHRIACLWGFTMQNPDVPRPIVAYFLMKVWGNDARDSAQQYRCARRIMKVVMIDELAW